MGSGGPYLLPVELVALAAVWWLPPLLIVCLAQHFVLRRWGVQRRLIRWSIAVTVFGSATLSVLSMTPAVPTAVAQLNARFMLPEPYSLYAMPSFALSSLLAATVVTIIAAAHSALRCRDRK